jgi:hypothetical protein
MGVHLFEDLPKLMEQYSDQIVELTTMVVQKAALAGGDYLARETPVDTGVARSNWIMSVDAPVNSAIPAYVPYPTYRLSHRAGEADGFSRKSETANLDSVRVQHSSAASKFQADRNNAIYITNNAPHIDLLNEGRSPQADAGFFDGSVDVAIKSIRGTWQLKEIP